MTYDFSMASTPIRVVGVDVAYLDSQSQVARVWSPGQDLWFAVLYDSLEYPMIEGIEPTVRMEDRVLLTDGDRWCPLFTYTGRLQARLLANRGLPFMAEFKVLDCASYLLKGPPLLYPDRETLRAAIREYVERMGLTK
jgi:hypothetical protein